MVSKVPAVVIKDPPRLRPREMALYQIATEPVRGHSEEVEVVAEMGRGGPQTLIIPQR